MLHIGKLYREIDIQGTMHGKLSHPLDDLQRIVIHCIHM